MRTCILDPASHMPGLKYLFPEAEYYAHEPDNFFTYVSTHHYTNEKHFNEYGFSYRTDWETINEENYDTIFLVAPFLDYYNVITNILTPHTERMLQRLLCILRPGRFQTVALFDIYDYDYDPNDINKDIPVNLYFKRNYNRTKHYKPNVFPFPCSMFVKPCVISMMLWMNLTAPVNRLNKAMWAGAVYNHVDKNFNPPIVRNRQDMFEKIQHRLSIYSGLSHTQYIGVLRNHKIAVDLMGVGDPNKRTFEILSNGVLLLTMVSDLEWGFETGDAFHPDTIFKTAEEFELKLDKLLTNEQHYNHCLSIQNALVTKYFSQERMRRSILEKLPAHPTLTTQPIVSRMKIIDSFIFYNELDLLKYRLTILNPYVDYFVLVEATHTFSGESKPLYYKENVAQFQEFASKIIHVVVDDFPIQFKVQDDRTWKNETFHRNAIQRGIERLSLEPQDCIFTSDLDEICDPKIMQSLRDGTLAYDQYNLNRLELDMYYYNLNCRVDHGWHGLKLITYGAYKALGLTFQDMRTWEWTHPVNTIPKGGWHLSYFGDAKAIANKIKHFSHQEYNFEKYTNEEIIASVVKNGGDILFRSHFQIRKLPIAENPNPPPLYDTLLKAFVCF